MPCCCDGYPPSPCSGDLLGSAQAAMEKIKELEQKLDNCKSEKERFQTELEAVKGAFSIMGNGG